MPQTARHCPFDGKPLPTAVAQDIHDVTGMTLDERYLLEERIGQGGLGQVYRARHLRIERHFAVKVMHAELAMQAEFLKRFDREARALSRLSHPGCVAVTDYGQTPHGVPYIVMELLKGAPLSVHLEREGLALGEALRIMRLLLDALDHAHGQGIVHRDIKPANIMLVPGAADERTLQPKLLDFGLAKLRTAEGEGTQLTAAGFVMGTPPYIAPELISAGGSSAQSSSDLYAMGVILYELACGRLPFDSEDLLKLLQKHLSEPPPAPRELRRELPRDLEQVMLRALAKQPTDRFPSAAAFRDALRRVRISARVAASRPPRPGTIGPDALPAAAGNARQPGARAATPPPGQRSLLAKPTLWIVLGAGVLLLAALGSIVVWLL